MYFKPKIAPQYIPYMLLKHLLIDKNSVTIYFDCFIINQNINNITFNLHITTTNANAYKACMPLNS